MTTEPERIQNTIAYLRRCQAARAAGFLVSYTTDPVWLLDQAINRRAGWPDDPSHSRGSCRPLGLGGRYPRRATGDHYHDVHRLAQALNSRVVVRAREVLRVLGRDARRIRAERLHEEG